MSSAEIAWRIQQKKLQRKEEKQFANANVSVCENVFNPKLESLQFNAAKLHVNLNNKQFGTNESISLLGFNYEDFKDKWHAGFQTNNEWLREFSYKLEYKQRDEIGDARTNWELNRHFQFAILAKNYHATGEKSYLEELERLFNSWDEQNPFLTGISWTSVMELAIRVINWMYTLAFLEQAEAPELKRKIATGIINMVDYVEQHRSRYSSANNHLLVEACAMALAGITFNYEPWHNTAVQVLTEELPRQNYQDGVNKELSLHYQVFGMEAYALVMHTLQTNGIEIPETWAPLLEKQAEYVSDCCGRYGETVVFGDDDEGKIIDLVGIGANRYKYTLQLMSCLLNERYDSMESLDETICWLFNEKAIAAAKAKPLYNSTKSVCYKEGGNTILKSKDGRILIGIDHAALGFGSIAAHGHADALSFQMYIDGKPVFVDPGTYIYHCNKPTRDELRKTCNHNTVCINGKDQSEMLGAFLWGKKANCKLLNFEQHEDSSVILIAEHDGYQPAIHRRTFEFDGEKTLTIKDEIYNDDNAKGAVDFVLAPNVKCSANNQGATIAFNGGELSLTFEDNSQSTPKRTTTHYSKTYGEIEETTVLTIDGITSKAPLTTIIRMESI